jgi:hypothetical protein
LSKPVYRQTLNVSEKDELEQVIMIRKTRKKTTHDKDGKDQTLSFNFPPPFFGRGKTFPFESFSQGAL